MPSRKLPPVVKFTAHKMDSKLIYLIAVRASKLLKIDREQLEMSISACHANGCPLNLEKLLNAKDVDLGHDVGGIHRFIDKRTGKIDPAKFDPRCSEPVPAKVVR
jgi:hypothetical protein